jgi:hypothetical protein
MVFIVTVRVCGQMGMQAKAAAKREREEAVESGESSRSRADTKTAHCNMT